MSFPAHGKEQNQGKKENIRLPVAVRGSKTSVLEFPFDFMINDGTVLFCRVIRLTKLPREIIYGSERIQVSSSLIGMVSVVLRWTVYGDLTLTD